MDPPRVCGVGPWDSDGAPLAVVLLPYASHGAPMGLGVAVCSLWGSYGTPIGLPCVCSASNGTTVGLSWGFHGTSTGILCSMNLTRVPHGTSMTIPFVYILPYDSTSLQSWHMGLPWVCSARMGLLVLPWVSSVGPWNSHGPPTGLEGWRTDDPWNCYGTSRS